MKKAGSDFCCSICLDFYKDPVILDCSHTFCRACISQVWEREQRRLCCPQCRQVFSHKSLRPNLALANIVESFKEMDSRAETSEPSRKRQKLEEKEEFYCEEHEEKLKLFCKEDQKLVCLICGMSQTHKSHNHLPIKEAFQIYKRKVNHLKQQIRDDFSKLHEFLYKEEVKLKEKLERKEMEILKQLEDNGIKTAQVISKLEQTISEIQKRLNSQRAEELLKDIKAALTGAEVKFEKPDRISTDLREGEFIGPLQYRVWRRMREVMDCPVLDSITIDPKTAKPDLSVSVDRTSLQFTTSPQNVSDNPKRFRSYCAALGSEGFNSGRHYWEMEVGDKSEWMLGVARESVERKHIVTTSIENGFYILKKDKKGYTVYNPFTNVPLPVKPRKIGVYLDYEGGQVSFYNAENMSHIHSYTNRFTEKMYPYFDTWWDIDGKNPEPLKLIALNK
ncbi:zinc-binding protein A33-like [Latimeria chalumnae]|uniref:zinc-binding protein A33-like n=1 Tax=Latimeria chalumnae TaxID=7897 RepID=UPI0003C14B61|nr:PREDICTED: zinc-binding protein A33-like [Latimeria chalumnae]|eukprot:XP_005998194.1 PREDICTED: zinc-binding protein A33-like [Latimeria chalumnae]